METILEDNNKSALASAGKASSAKKVRDKVRIKLEEVYLNTFLPITRKSAVKLADIKDLYIIYK